VADVALHELAGARRVAPLDRLENRLVLLDVLAEERGALAQDRATEIAGEASVQPSERRDEHVVARGLLDHLVEGVVGAAPERDLGVGDLAAALPGGHGPSERFAELRLRRMQAVGLVVADPLRGKLGGEALELGAHLVRIADLAWGETAHESAPVGAELDDPGRLELPERLADRRPADPELLGEGFLAQAGAGRQLAAQDPRLELGGELVDQRPPLVEGVLGYRRYQLLDPFDERLDPSLK
jgi:hypothetical protein